VRSKAGKSQLSLPYGIDNKTNKGKKETKNKNRMFSEELVNGNMVDLVVSLIILKL